MADRKRLLDEVSAELQNLFGLSADQISADALLTEDLDLDSIDAVDLIVRLQEKTGRKISPDLFKSARTVGDIVTAVDRLLQD